MKGLGFEIIDRDPKVQLVLSRTLAELGLRNPPPEVTGRIRTGPAPVRLIIGPPPVEAHGRPGPAGGNPPPGPLTPRQTTNIVWM
jgi:hypothetical protein